MSEINAGIFKKEEGGSSPELIGKTELTSPYFMVHYDLIQILEV